MQLNEDEKVRMVRQLNEVFITQTEEQVRRLCQSNNWDVKACVDQLVSLENTDSENLPPNVLDVEAGKTTTANDADTTQNFHWSNDGFQIPQKGAIPKNKNNINESANKRQSSPRTAAETTKIHTRKHPTATTSKIGSYNNNTIGYFNNCSTSLKGNVVFQRICDQIKEGFRVMILMRGASGSGKSSLAHSLIRESFNLDNTQYDIGDFILSTDDYWMDNKGNYKYDSQRLPEAHEWNRKRAYDKAISGCSPIVIDNTNIQMWEMMPYVQIAVRNGYIIELLEPNTSWRFSASKLFLKSTHKVPREKIQNTLDRYEKATVNDLLKMLKETKYTVKLPQKRLWPPIVQEKKTSPPESERSQTEEIVCKTFEDMSIVEQLPSVSASELKTEPGWTVYVDPNAPKVQRSKSRNRVKVETEDETAIESNISELRQQQTHQDWQTYEDEASIYWAQLSQQEQITKNTTKANNSGKSLLELLRESVNEDNIKQEESSVKMTDNKQTSTNDGLRRHRVDCQNESPGFVSLRQIYPNKQVADLWDLYIKCNGDVDWAVDLLLKEDELALSNEPTHIIDKEDDFNCNCFGATEQKSLDGKVSQLNDSISNTSLNTTTINPLTTSRPQRQRVRRSNPNLREMKLQIENAFVLGDEQYSEHTRKIRDIRNGALDMPLPQNWVQTAEENGGSFSNDNDPNEDDNETDAVEDRLLEFDLGENLVTQLCNTFKSELTLGERLPKEYATTVFMPRSLAKSLYMLWMETVYNQMEEQRQQLLREDEQFARLLKNPKYEDCAQTPHNVNELLDMELAWSIYNDDKQRQNERLAELTKPNDIATHLTKMKLCEQFPDIPPDTLLDVYAAQGHSYIKTLEALGVEDGCRMAQQELMNKQDGLIERAKREHEVLNRQAEAQQVEQQLQQTYGDDVDTFTNKISNNNNANAAQIREERKHHALHDFEKTRNMAAHHSQLKAECYQKAKEAIQKGNGGAAIYYSEIANLHKKKIDMYNHRAANCIMQVHKYTQNNPDLLDLHYLHVLEAIGCLDLFLDQHITALRQAMRPYKHVFIITGRGLHSAGGVSTIKNKVKSRLKERNLKWNDVNPGLLKVKIFAASRHSKNV